VGGGGVVWHCWGLVGIGAGDMRRFRGRVGIVSTGPRVGVGELCQ
jgi:hypothetical protein